MHSPGTVRTMLNHMGTPHMKANPSAHPRKPEKYLRLPAVESVVGFKKSAIYEGMRAGTFPLCIRITARAVAWRESDIVAWQDERNQSVVR